MTPRDEVRQRIRGLYGIADAGAAGGDPVALGVDLLAGGCRLVQLRCKGWAADELLRAARDLGLRCRAVGATFVVNDDAAVAAAAGADGVHVGQGDGPGEGVRRALGKERILGRSTGSLDDLLAPGDADYLAFGPLFDTPRLSRPKPAVGLEGLRRARALVDRPLVAIGGIGPDTLARVRATGVDGWAVIGAIALATDRVAATRALV